jgi:penicillin-binding protein 1B
MYNTLANGGFRSPLRAVRAVIDEDGKPLKAPELEVTEAAPAEAVYALNRMLIEVFRTRYRAPGQEVAAIEPRGRGQDRHVERLSRQLVRRLFRWPRDRRVDGPRRQRADRAHRHDGALQAWTRLMASITTTSFEPLMPEDVEDRWIDYYSGLETSPYCSGSAVSMPFEFGTVLNPSPACPPGITPEEGALMQRATVSLERALRIEPNNPLLWIEMGRLRMDQRNYAQAESMGRKALVDVCR